MLPEMAQQLPHAAYLFSFCPPVLFFGPAGNIQEGLVRHPSVADLVIKDIKDFRLDAVFVFAAVNFPELSVHIPSVLSLIGLLVNM